MFTYVIYVRVFTIFHNGRAYKSNMIEHYREFQILYFFLPQNMNFKSCI